MVSVSINGDLLKKIGELKKKLGGLMDDVVKPAANESLSAMKAVIETDESANASSPTGAKTGWTPTKGRRTVDDTMYKTLDIFEKNKSVMIGWQNSEDYIEGQDLGWGSGGPAPEPEGALFANVHGAHFTKFGYEMANKLIDKELRKLAK